jgi:membrane protein
MPDSSRVSDLFSKLPTLGSFAAEMAFYLALSLVPFLSLTAVAAVTWLPANLGGPIADTLIKQFAPEAGLDATAIANWVGSAHGSGWLAAGVLLAAWASFRFMAACVWALASLGGVDRRNWRHRVLSVVSALFLVLVWMSALVLLSFVILVAPSLQETLGAQRWLLLDTPTSAITRGLAFPVLLLAIALTYRSIPGLRARGWRPWVMAGLATLGWIAAGWAVTQVLPSLWRGRALYGALGSFVVFLLWSYVNAWLLLAFGHLSGSAARH